MKDLREALIAEYGPPHHKECPWPEGRGMCDCHEFESTPGGTLCLAKISKSFICQMEREYHKVR